MRGRKFATLLLGTALLVGTVAWAEDAAERVTVKGEILDLACYVAKGAHGAEHAGCAKACVKGGQPMGLLAADGKVYLLWANHGNGDAYEQAKDHAGKQVEVVGTLASRSGIDGLEVLGVKAL